MEHPHYIAVSNTNRVIVSDSNNHRIQVFDVNGCVLSTFGTEGSEEGQFKFPRFDSYYYPNETTFEMKTLLKTLILTYVFFSSPKTLKMKFLGASLSTIKVTFVLPIRATIAFKFSIRMVVFYVPSALGVQVMLNSKVLKGLQSCPMVIYWCATGRTIACKCFKCFRSQSKYHLYIY